MKYKLDQDYATKEGGVMRFVGDSVWRDAYYFRNRAGLIFAYDNNDHFALHDKEYDAWDIVGELHS